MQEVEVEYTPLVSLTHLVQFHTGGSKRLLKNLNPVWNLSQENVSNHAACINAKLVDQANASDWIAKVEPAPTTSAAAEQYGVKSRYLVPPSFPHKVFVHALLFRASSKDASK